MSEANQCNHVIGIFICIKSRYIWAPPPLNSKMLTYFLGGGLEMLTVADMGEGGVKNSPKSADVLYGRPLIARKED